MVNYSHKLSSWINTRGWRVTSQTSVPVNYGGFNMTVGQTQPEYITVSAVVSEKIKPRVLKQLKTALSSYGLLEYHNKMSILRLKVLEHPAFTYNERVDGAVVAMAEILTSYKISPRPSCEYCNRIGSDTVVEIYPGVLFVAHEYCHRLNQWQKANPNAKVAKKPQEGRQQKSKRVFTPVAIILAIIGGILGGLIYGLSIALFGLNARFVAAVIPAFIMLGYRIGRAKYQLSQRILGIVLSVIMLLLFLPMNKYFTPYVHPYKSMMLVQKVEDRQIDEETAKTMNSDYDYYKESYQTFLENLKAKGLAGRLSPLNYHKINDIFTFVKQNNYIKEVKYFWTNINLVKDLQVTIIQSFVFLVIGMLLSFARYEEILKSINGGKSSKKRVERSYAQPPNQSVEELFLRGQNHPSGGQQKPTSHHGMNYYT